MGAFIVELGRYINNSNALPIPPYPRHDTG
jgi:hypothetical protein